MRSALGRVAYVVLALSCLCDVVPGQASDSTLRILQFSVGQGDAALIITPEKRHLLIDAGRSSHAVAYMLEELGVDTLHLVIASHNHADHIGGMMTILSSFPVRAYMDNGIPHTTATYSGTLAAVERSGAQYLIPVSRTITLGSLIVRVLPPPFQRSDQNNGSVGVLLEYGEFRALYTGDSERRQLEAWLASASIPEVTLVKVPHHGARNGTTTQWIQATCPELVLISVGRNSFGHPAPEVEYSWAAAGAKVYRTDESGTVEVRAMRDATVIVHTSVGATDTIPRPLSARAP